MQANGNDLVDRVRAGLGKLGGRLASTLIGLGLLAILLGWNGAASDVAVAAQIPYLLSGLGVGLALVGTGAALMVVQSAREDRARLEAKLDVLIDAVTRSGGRLPSTAPFNGGSAVGSGPRPLTVETLPAEPEAAPSHVAVRPAATAPRSRPAPQAEELTPARPEKPAEPPVTAVAPSDLAGLVVAGSASYHVPSCKLVQGRDELTYLTAEEARADHLAPCRVCQPDSASVTA